MEQYEEIDSMLRDTTLMFSEIADLAGVSNKVVWGRAQKVLTATQRKKRWKTNLSKTKMGTSNPMFGKFREEHHNYKGVVSDGKGYAMILRPDWYTGRRGSRHVFVHHVVMCSYLGITEMPKGFCIHHINGDRLDNSIDNLALMSQTGHQRLHAREKRATTKVVEHKQNLRSGD